MSDDGFINLRVVDQVLAGNGPVFNAGERVEIATSPLWIAVLAVFSAVLAPVPAEWVAVLLGIGATGWGVIAAQMGALRLPGGGRRAGWAVPLGAIVLVALPPVWDFASSGLETGLSLAWIGTCWFFLTDERRSHHWATAVLCGLGPLVRPDLALLSAAFLLVLLVTVGDRSWSSRLRTLAAAAALPVLWQLFRMGYYGALVPNTAFAKEASTARWGQGWRYLTDFAGTYLIAIPLVAVLVGGIGPLLLRARRGGDRRTIALAVAPVAGGLLHWLYVVRVGGDFMHARLLLPGLLAILLPVAAVRVTGAGLVRFAVPLVGVWALGVVVGVRSPYDDPMGPEEIADERAVYAGAADHEHPITLEDYGRHPWVPYGATARRLAEEGREVLIVGVAGFQDPGQWITHLGGAGRPVVVFNNVGLLSYAAGVKVHVVDQYGLGDVIAGRQQLDVRGRPGHEKALHPAWPVARFAGATARHPGGLLDSPATAAARRALGCGDLADVLAAAEEPLTVGRVLANMSVALRLHGVRFPGDPIVAVDQLCP